jgi:hypothetical protein
VVHQSLNFLSNRPTELGDNIRGYIKGIGELPGEKCLGDKIARCCINDIGGSCSA